MVEHTNSITSTGKPVTAPAATTEPAEDAKEPKLLLDEETGEMVSKK